MINYIIFLAANFLFLNTMEYYIHKLSHNYKYGGILYKYHHKHHFIDYPISRLIRDKSDDVLSTNGPYIVVLISVYILIYFILSTTYYIIFLIESSLYFYIMEIMHQYYHLNDSYLEKYKWFTKLKVKHHIHHKNTTKNLNLVFFLNDTIHKSLKPKYKLIL